MNENNDNFDILNEDECYILATKNIYITKN